MLKNMLHTYICMVNFFCDCMNLYCIQVYIYIVYIYIYIYFLNSNLMRPTHFYERGYAYGASTKASGSVFYIYHWCSRFWRNLDFFFIKKFGYSFSWLWSIRICDFLSYFIWCKETSVSFVDVEFCGCSLGLRISAFTVYGYHTVVVTLMTFCDISE